MRDKRKKRTEKRFHKNSVFSRRLFLIGVSVSAFLLTGLALLYLFVFSIREIEVVVPGGGEEGCTFVRYEEDLTEKLEVCVTTTHGLASKQVTYMSGQPDLVEVTEDGILTAKNPGTAIITIKSKYNPWVKTEFPVTVIQKAVGMEIEMPSEIPVNEYYYLLHTGDKPVMKPKPFPENALVENLVFESENPEIVSVTEGGVLEVHKTGITVIHVSWTGPHTEKEETEDLGEFMVNVCRETNHDRLADHELKWYEESCLVAHALGNAGEYTYTNTKDALEESIAEGYKVLEVDLGMTADEEIVCRHTWYSDDFDVSYDGSIPDLVSFEQEKYHGVLTTLSARGLLEIWSSHPELYFMLDVKQDENTNFLEVLEKFTALAKEMDQEQLLEHMIVQLYAVEDYDRINAVYPVKNWLFTIYQLSDEEGAEVEAAAFAAEKGFGVFTVPASCLGNNYFVDLADEYGLNLFIHVADREEDVWRLSRRGIYGYYSDFLKPNEAHTNGEN